MSTKDVAKRKRYPIFVVGTLTNKNGKLFARWETKSVSDENRLIKHEYPIIARRGIDEKIITPYLRQYENSEKRAEFGGTLIPYEVDGTSQTFLRIDWVRFTDPSPKQKGRERI